MPRAPRKCPHPGCEERITTTRYCEADTIAHWEGAPRTRTTQHQRWVTAVLKRDRYQCQLRGPKCSGVATIADHIIPDAEGGATTLGNGQGVCANCHQEKTKHEAIRGLHRIYGQPDENAPF